MTTPNFGAINAMGSQFTSNVFSEVAGKATKANRKLQAQANRRAATSSAPKPPTSNAGGMPTSSSPLPPNAAAAGRARRQARAQAGPTPTPAPPTYPTSPTPHAPGAGGGPVSGFNVMQGRANRQARAQASRAQPNAVPFSHAPGTPPPTTPAAFGPAQNPVPNARVMPANRAIVGPNNPFQSPAPAQSNVSNLGQFKAPKPSATPFSNAGTTATPKAAPKPSTTPFSVGPVTPAPKPATAASPQPSTNPFANKSNANAPAQKAQQQLSSQFANTQQGNNAPFPTHQHPSGSSNMILQNASAALSQPGRPNTMIVGSRNASPGGIAAAGSRLEAWANAKSSAVRARQESKKAGGRDRDLAARAAAAENLSNQPLNRFAP